MGLGGAHRVHFEHSLLHDSVTTIRVAPGKTQSRDWRNLVFLKIFAFKRNLTGAGRLEKYISRIVRDYLRLM